MADLPALPGYVFRSLDAPADFARMAELINVCQHADGIEEVTTVESIESNYRHLEHCDPATDMILATRDGRLVGYTRADWWQEVDGPRVHAVFTYVDPDARGDGLTQTLMAWSEQRNREVAAADDATEIVLQGWAEQTKQPDLAAAYEKSGYTAVTFGAEMVRADLEDIPDASLPEGVEIRPVEPEHLRMIWEADNEAFRDHWGYAAGTENDYRRFLDFPHRDESLWKIAWHGDQVVGQVKSFINAEENDTFGRRRGYTEFISTAREWRKQGIATTLICESLRELRRRRMTEAALGVHTENPNGAFRLYESLGFRVVSLYATYRKTVQA